MRRELSSEGEVVKAGDAEHGLMDAITLEPAVPQDLPVLQSGQSMLNPSTGFAVHLVLSLLLRAQAPLTTPFAVTIVSAQKMKVRNRVVGGIRLSGGWSVHRPSVRSRRYVSMAEIGAPDTEYGLRAIGVP